MQKRKSKEIAKTRRRIANLSLAPISMMSARLHIHRSDVARGLTRADFYYLTRRRKGKIGIANFSPSVARLLRLRSRLISRQISFRRARARVCLRLSRCLYSHEHLRNIQRSRAVNFDGKFYCHEQFLSVGHCARCIYMKCT